jgi:hypothetical protein
LEDTKPDKKEAIRTPKEPTRKIEPAWLGLNAKSCPMVGMSGANMKRLMKVRKKRRVRKITVPIKAEKGSGVGHALSVIGPPEAKRVMENLEKHTMT